MAKIFDYNKKVIAKEARIIHALAHTDERCGLVSVQDDEYQIELIRDHLEKQESVYKDPLVQLGVNIAGLQALLKVFQSDPLNQMTEKQLKMLDVEAIQRKRLHAEFALMIMEALRVFEES